MGGAKQKGKAPIPHQSPIPPPSKQAVASSSSASASPAKQPVQPITVASVLKASNHYTVLKLKPAALNKAKNPKGKVTAAFRKASLKVHPDKNPHKDAAAAFVKVREAHRVLSSPVLRAAYDEELRAKSQLASLASSSAQQMAKADFEAGLYREFARQAESELKAEAERRRQEAERERERARDAGQTKKEARELREAEDRVKLAQQRVRAAKRRRQKTQDDVAAARAKFKGAYGGGAGAGAAAAEKAAATAARELAAASAAAAAAKSAAEKLAFAARRARKEQRRAEAEEAISKGVPLGKAPPLPKSDPAAAAAAAAAAEPAAANAAAREARASEATPQASANAGGDGPRAATSAEPHGEGTVPRPEMDQRTPVHVAGVQASSQQGARRPPKVSTPASAAAKGATSAEGDGEERSAAHPRAAAGPVPKPAPTGGGASPPREPAVASGAGSIAKARLARQAARQEQRARQDAIKRAQAAASSDATPTPGTPYRAGPQGLGGTLPPDVVETPARATASDETQGGGRDEEQELLVVPAAGPVQLDEAGRAPAWLMQWFIQEQRV